MERPASVSEAAAQVLVAWWYEWLGAESDMEARGLALIFNNVLMGHENPLQLSKKAIACFKRFTTQLVFAYPEAFCRYSRRDLPPEFLGPGLIEAIFKLLKHDYGHHRKDLHIDDSAHLLVRFEEACSFLRYGVDGDVDHATVSGTGRLTWDGAQDKRPRTVRSGGGATDGLADLTDSAPPKLRTAVGGATAAAGPDHHTDTLSLELPEVANTTGIRQRNDLAELLGGGSRYDHIADDLQECMPTDGVFKGGNTESAWGRKGSSRKKKAQELLRFIRESCKALKLSLGKMKELAMGALGANGPTRATSRSDQASKDSAVETGEELSMWDTADAMWSLDEEGEEGLNTLQFRSPPTVPVLDLSRKGRWKEFLIEPTTGEVVTTTVRSWSVLSPGGKPKLSLSRGSSGSSGGPMTLRSLHNVPEDDALYGSATMYLSQLLGSALGVGAMVAFMDIGLSKMPGSLSQGNAGGRNDFAGKALLEAMRQNLLKHRGGTLSGALYLRMSGLSMTVYHKDQYHREGWSKHAQEAARAVFHVVVPLNAAAHDTDEGGVYLARRGHFPVEYVAKHSFEGQDWTTWQQFVEGITRQCATRGLLQEQATDLWPFSLGGDRAADQSYCLLKGGALGRPLLFQVVAIEHGNTFYGRVGVPASAGDIDGYLVYSLDRHLVPRSRKEVLAVLHGEKTVISDREGGTYAVSVSAVAVEDAVAVWLAQTPYAI